MSHSWRPPSHSFLWYVSLVCMSWGWQLWDTIWVYTLWHRPWHRLLPSYITACVFTGYRRQRQSFTYGQWPHLHNTKAALFHDFYFDNLRIKVCRQTSSGLVPCCMILMYVPLLVVGTLVGPLGENTSVSEQLFIIVPATCLMLPLQTAHNMRSVLVAGSVSFSFEVSRLQSLMSPNLVRT